MLVPDDLEGLQSFSRNRIIRIQFQRLAQFALSTFDCPLVRVNEPKFAVKVSTRGAIPTKPKRFFKLHHSLRPVPGLCGLHTEIIKLKDRVGETLALLQ